jgi:hypothetical protein
VQTALEKELTVDETEKAAIKLVEQGREDGARKLLRKFTLSAAAKAHTAYKELFPLLMARFHDGFTCRYMFIPFEGLPSTSFYNHDANKWFSDYDVFTIF